MAHAQEKFDHTYFEKAAVLTPRLALVPLDERDAGHIAEWRADPSNASQFWADRGPTLNEQIGWTRSPRWNRVDYIVWHLRDRVRIGTVGYASIDLRDGSAIKGTMIGDKSYRKQGLAFEANCGWLKFAFDVLGLDRVEALIREGNDDSFALNIRIGMKLLDDSSVHHPTRGKFQRLTLDRALYSDLDGRGLYGGLAEILDVKDVTRERYPEIGERSNGHRPY